MLENDRISKAINYLMKARGVPTGPGQAPGPPPRPGLEWNPQSHRWVKPEDAGWEETKRLVDEGKKIPPKAPKYPGGVKPSGEEQFSSGLTRKPWDWKDVDRVDSQQMNLKGKDFGEVIGSLEEYEADDVLDADSLSEDFRRPPAEQVFIMNRGGNRYLVDTQGYNYPRYIGKLEGTISKAMAYLMKARGVPTGPGQAPGPPPRPGLEWNPETHRWVRGGAVEVHLPDEGIERYRGQTGFKEALEGAVKTLPSSPRMDRGKQFFDRAMQARDTSEMKYRLRQAIKEFDREKDFSEKEKHVVKRVKSYLVDIEWYTADLFSKEGTMKMQKGTISKAMSYVMKTRGVPTGPGQAPGPPPRPGLEWKPETHRWIRGDKDAYKGPSDEVFDASEAFYHETVKKLKPLLQGAHLKFGDYEEDIQYGINRAWEDACQDMGVGAFPETAEDLNKVKAHLSGKMDSIIDEVLEMVTDSARSS